MGAIILGAGSLPMFAAPSLYNTASQAVGNLQPTCISLTASSNVPDWTMRTASNLTASYSPSAVMQTSTVVYGVHNYSSRALNSTWTMEATFGASGIILTDQRDFNTLPGATKILSFSFPVNTTTAVSLIKASQQAAQAGVGMSLGLRLTRIDGTMGYYFINHSRAWPDFGSLNLGSTGNLLPSC